MDFRSGSGSKFNCAARVGSDDLGYGPGSGFSFEPVQTSSSSVYKDLETSRVRLYAVSSAVQNYAQNRLKKESRRIRKISESMPNHVFYLFSQPYHLGCSYTT